ncbi:hypothetical protein, partial [uncultured Comamonas sp.]
SWLNPFKDLSLLGNRGDSRLEIRVQGHGQRYMLSAEVATLVPLAQFSVPILFQFRRLEDGRNQWKWVKNDAFTRNNHREVWLLE